MMDPMPSPRPDCPDPDPVPVDPSEDPHTRYARTLPHEERLLVILRAELYGNSWETMLADLEERLKGRPYIFKLVHRIEEDIRRAQKLQAYEQKHLIDLYDYLDVA